MTTIEDLRNNTKNDLKILIPAIIKIKQIGGGNKTLRELLEQYGANTSTVPGYDEDGNPV